MLERGNGNLLRADTDALVNTVNTVGAMGKGIALQFDKAFPENSRQYERACRAGEVQIGRMFVVERLAAPRFIINFPTKKHWRSPSQLDWIRAGLDDLVAQVRARGIRSIAVPPLGCGLGGLDWRDVKPLVVRAFESLPDVRVLLFEPAGAPAPDAMVVHERRPDMTPGRAALIALMSDYVATGYEYRLSLLEIQKLAYFMQLAGEPLRLQYVRGPYGPYADALRKVVRHLDGHYMRGMGDGRTGPTTPIELLPEAASAAEAALGHDSATGARRARVLRLIEGFETPFGMELLATVHWVMSGADGTPGARTVDEALAAIADWNDRKATLMREPQVRAAFERLTEQNWV